ncbi:MAG: dihydroorotate dehydrogenase electron transfer subunit [Candidatus Thorarchaeota archaeon]
MANRFDLPYCLPIFRKNFENDYTVSISFLIPERKMVKVIPGQYFMLWLPGKDEIPIAVSQYQKNIMSFTIRGVGSTTDNLIKKEINSLIGLRGPFGNGFDLEFSKNVFIVAGGIGIAPLRFLINYLISNSSKPSNIVLMQGAKTKSELLFREEFEKLPISTEFCTEDGSYGFNGLVSEKMEDSFLNLTKGSSDCEIYSCGPELMLKNVLTIAQDHNLAEYTQICLADRYIRCGFGICGSCYLDDLGLSICQDGPIFRGNVLAKVKDFGKFGRMADGSKYSFN